MRWAITTNSRMAESALSEFQMGVTGIPSSSKRAGSGRSCPSSNGLRQFRRDRAEALAHRVSSLSGFHLVLQSSFSNGVAFNPFSLQEDGLASAEVDIGGG